MVFKMDGNVVAAERDEDHYRHHKPGPVGGDVERFIADYERWKSTMTWEEQLRGYQEEILRLQLEEVKHRRDRALYEAAAASEAYTAAKLTTERARTANRPAVLFGASLRHTTYGKWIASAQDMYAYGDSPEEAFANFDKKWTEKSKNEAANN
jgi:hypothetical protein